MNKGMIMRKLFTMLLVILGVTSYAQLPSTVLSQLGARGVTTISDGTSGYKHYLVLLGEDGKLDPSLYTASGSEAGDIQLNNIFFVDRNGTNTADAGTPGKPFETLEYALTQITTNATIIFGPGEHPGASTSIINPDITKLTLIGYNAANTKITSDIGRSIAFHNSKPASIDLMGITVGNIVQENNVPTVIKAQFGAILENFSRSYASYVTFYRDPSAEMPNLVDNYEIVELHAAESIAYDPNNVGIWAVEPKNVQDAIDILAGIAQLPTDVIGGIVYWDGQEWVAISGTENQVLLGGTEPIFGELELSGAVIGSHTATELAAESVTVDKLGQDVTEILDTILPKDTELAGDVIGPLTNAVVIRLDGRILPEFPTNIGPYALVYDADTGQFKYQDITPEIWSQYAANSDVDLSGYSITNIGDIVISNKNLTTIIQELIPPPPAASTNWSESAAISDVDFNNYGLTNVSYIMLNGVVKTNWDAIVSMDAWSLYPATNNVNIGSNLLLNVGGIQLDNDLRTAWPDASDWALFPAADNVNISGKGLQQVGFITLNGITRSTWPASLTNWYDHPAYADVDINSNKLKQVFSIELNGETITAWPISAVDWSLYAAQQNVDLNQFDLYNIGKLIVNDWQVSANDGNLIFHNFTNDTSFVITAEGHLRQSAGAGENFVLVSSPDGTGTWTNKLVVKEIEVTDNNLILPNDANAGLVWTAIDDTGRGHWMPFTVTVTNEADPVAIAMLTNYYMTTEELIILLATNYLSQVEAAGTYAVLDHTHPDYMTREGFVAEADLRYAHKKHLHEGVYSEIDHTHTNYIVGSMTQRSTASTEISYTNAPEYGYVLSYVNKDTTYWRPVAELWDGGSGWNTDQLEVRRLSVGPVGMPMPEIMNIYSRTGRLINLAASGAGDVSTKGRAPSLVQNRDPGNPAVNIDQVLIPEDNVFANIAGSGGIRVFKFDFNIPDLSYVHGIEVEIIHKKGVETLPALCKVQINNNGYMSTTNYFQFSSNIPIASKLGSPTTVWGLTSIDGGPLAGWDVNQNDFSVEIDGLGHSLQSYLIDGVVVTIHYTHSSTSYDVLLSTDSVLSFKHRDSIDPVLELTPANLRIPTGAAEGWVLTAIDNDGTAEWRPSQGGGQTTNGINTNTAMLLSGLTIPTGIYNTVTFTNIFEHAPTVLAGWVSSTIDEIATITVIDTSVSDFTYQIVSSAGPVVTNWAIGWIASDPIVVSGGGDGGGVARWSQIPAITDVNMNNKGIKNITYLQLGTNAPISHIPVVRTTSFVIQYPEIGNKILAWRTPYAIEITRISGLTIDTSYRNSAVVGSLRYRDTNYQLSVIVDQVTIYKNNEAVTSEIIRDVPADCWLEWDVTDIIDGADIEQVTVTIDYIIK